MRIACLTPVTHLSGVMQKLREYGDVVYLPEPVKQTVRKLLMNERIDAIFTNPNKLGFVLQKDVLAGTPVKLINTASTGTNHIDVNFCAKNGIRIMSLTHDHDLLKELPSTSELAFGLFLSLARRIVPAHGSVIKECRWDYEPFMGRQVRGMNAGIVGYGRLGKLMAHYCDAFGMNVRVCDPYVDDAPFDNVDLLELLQVSDMVSLHVHVNDETRRMIGFKEVNTMKMGCILINTARGELVDEDAVHHGLWSCHLGGYGTDVLACEFSEGLMKMNPIRRAVAQGFNVVITPHIGGMSWEGQRRAFLFAADKFKEVSDG